MHWRNWLMTFRSWSSFLFFSTSCVGGIEMKCAGQVLIAGLVMIVFVAYLIVRSFYGRD